MLLSLVRAFPATNYVILGDNVQTNINASAPGDTLVVQAGSYSGNLVFNRSLTVLRSGSNLLQFAGTVQMAGTGAQYFADCQFSSAVTVLTTGQVSFARCEFLSPVTSQAANLLLSGVRCASGFSANLAVGSGTNLQAFDSRIENGLSISGGKSLLKRTMTTALGLTLTNNASVELLRYTNGGQFIAVSSGGTRPSVVAAQCNFDLVNAPTKISGYDLWLGYSKFNLVNQGMQLTNCNTVSVGNRIFDDYSAGFTMLICHGGTFRAYNTAITRPGDSGGVAVGVISNRLEFRNCTVRGGNGNSATPSVAVTVSASQSALIENSIIEAKYGVVSDTLLPVSYCNIYGLNPLDGQAGPLINCINSPPQFQDTILFKLSPGSPCLNAGAPDPIFNDRDGTRNDMGYTGGPLFNEANYTNNNPMVFFQAAMPQTVLKGLQTNILINAAASAGH